MSTPPGDSRDPTVGSADRSHETPRRAGLERQDYGNDRDPPRSPYAPSRTHQRTGAERYPASNAHDPLGSPYAPQTARMRFTAEAAPRDETMGDLERLVTSLYAIHSEEAVARMPRAMQLPPVAGLAPVVEGRCRRPSPYSLRPSTSGRRRADVAGGCLRRPLSILINHPAYTDRVLRLDCGLSPPRAWSATASVAPAPIAPPSTSVGPPPLRRHRRRRTGAADQGAGR